jgi:hypothetical protein
MGVGGISGVVSNGRETVARWRVAGLVADGYTTLAGGGVTATVDHNFVELSGIESTGPPIQMTLSGPAGKWHFYLDGPGVFPEGPWPFGRVGLQVPHGG